MPPEPVRDDDYVSEEDSDFALDDAPAEDSSGSDDDEAPDTDKPAARKGKQQGEDGADDAGFENSGDEAIIEKGKSRQRKSKRKALEADGDEGGEGGLIKTRRMRAAEKAERRADTSIGPVTIDVDTLWAQMTSGPSTSKSQAELAIPITQSKGDTPSSQPRPTTAEKKPDGSDLIRIKRTYNFAGKVHTEEKLVARDSAEAKLYLAENGLDSAPPDDASSSSAQKRMPRKAFRSIFEPVVADGLSQRADLNLCVSERLRARELAKEAEAKKLNTVEKSRMDWAGFVDREGIKDELELAGKSKHSFAARQDFLARSEAVREDEARKLRASGRG